MKNLTTRAASPAANSDTIKISKREVEKMIELELQSAMNKKEKKLDTIIEAVQQQLQQGMNYEDFVKSLEARMMTVTKRAEAALTQINSNVTNLQPSLVNADSSRSHLAEDITKTMSPTSIVTTVSEFMENTKKEIQHLYAENAALKAVVEDMRERTTPSPTTVSCPQCQENTTTEIQHLHTQTAALKAVVEEMRERTTPSPTTISRPQCQANTTKEVQDLYAENAALKAVAEEMQERPSPSSVTTKCPQSELIEGLAKLIKKEPVDLNPESRNSPPPASLKRAKEETLPPESDRSAKRMKSQMEELPYPPLPKLPSATSLSPEAASYNLPPRLRVELALIKNPPQLSLLWSLEDNEPPPPPMESYCVLFTTEQVIGSGVFQNWQNLGEYSAEPLPMFSIITKYRPGHKICVTVVGKDKFGRYGPYSKVACAVI